MNTVGAARSSRDFDGAHRRSRSARLRVDTKLRLPTSDSSRVRFSTARKIHRSGPDVLWRTDATFDFIIEAKNEKLDESRLYKKDHAQLLEAEHWFHGDYPGRESVRVSALPEPMADQKATPAGTFALRLADVTRLVSALRGVLIEMVGATGGPDALREQCEAALVKAKLKPGAIRATFMKPFGKAEPKAK